MRRVNANCCWVCCEESGLPEGYEFIRFSEWAKLAFYFISGYYAASGLRPTQSILRGRND